MRAFNRFIVLSLALLVGLGGAAVFWIKSSLPGKGGTVQISGISAKTEIIRDSHGVPHIFAVSDRDAAFALGFAHAQDRLWQMELQRRVGAGRLSEILGNRTAGLDRRMRTLGYYRAAKASFAHLAPEVQAYLRTYAKGVNGWIKSRSGALPPEFLLLRHQIEPWQPADSIVWGKLMGRRLSGNFRDELLRARLRDRLSDRQIDELWPAGTADGELTLERHGALPALGSVPN